MGKKWCRNLFIGTNNTASTQHGAECLELDKSIYQTAETLRKVTRCSRGATVPQICGTEIFTSIYLHAGIFITENRVLDGDR